MNVEQIYQATHPPFFRNQSVFANGTTKTLITYFLKHTSSVII